MTRRIAIVTLGSRGDVQPYVALGLGLQEAGYDVTLVPTAEFESFVISHGLRCAATNMSYQKMFEIPGADPDRPRPWAMVRVMVRRLPALMAEFSERCAGSDLLIYTPLAVNGVPHIAEKLGVSAVLAPVQPLLTPTRDYPNFRFPDLGPSAYNRLTHAIHRQVTWLGTRRTINAFRKRTLGLPPLGVVRRTGNGDAPTLYAFSPTICPRPTDWGAAHHVTGFWFLNRLDDWQPPAELLEFLQAGPPPIYVGFGSMSTRRPRQLTRAVTTALERTGIRAVYDPGPRAPSDLELPDHVFRLEGAPHEWLFKHVSAVVHHGGAGTVGASLRAGLPTATVPFFFDHRFFSDRVYRLGAGPRPLPHTRLTSGLLAGRLEAVAGSESMRERAARIGEQLRAEDGVAEAVDVLRRYLDRTA